MTVPDEAIELGEVAVADEAITALKGSFGGDVVTADDAGYEAARQVWNGNVDRRPAVIAQCRGARPLELMATGKL